MTPSRAPLTALALFLAWWSAGTACGAPASPAQAPKAPDGAPPLGVAPSPAPRSLGKVVYSYNPGSGAQTPTWVTKEAGLWEKYGLEVEITPLEGGQQQMAALLRDDVQFSNISVAAVVQAAVQGADPAIIASVYTAIPYSLMVRPPIASFADLRGKVIGVTRVGDSTYLQLRRILEVSGLNPDQDLSMRPIGTFPNLASALMEGLIDAALLQPPLTAVVRGRGMEELTALRNAPVPYMTAPIQARKSWMEAHPDTVRAFLKGYLEGLQRWKRDPDFSVKVMSTYLRNDDLEELRDAWRFYTQIAADYPIPDPEAVRISIEDSLKSGGDPGLAAADPATMVDPRWVRELQQGKFLDTLPR